MKQLYHIKEIKEIDFVDRGLKVRYNTLKLSGGMQMDVKNQIHIQIMIIINIKLIFQFLNYQMIWN